MLYCGLTGCVNQLIDKVHVVPSTKIFIVMDWLLYFNFIQSATVVPVHVLRYTSKNLKSSFPIMAVLYGPLLRLFVVIMEHRNSHVIYTIISL